MPLNVLGLGMIKIFPVMFKDTCQMIRPLLIFRIIKAEKT
jgi:hypothetical protein